MRELVLSEASAEEFDGDIDGAVQHLVGIADGVADLVNSRVVAPALKTSRDLYQVRFGRDQSMYDMLNELVRRGRSRDQGVFLMRLAQKYPLLADLNEIFVDRFLRCEVTSPCADGALMLCVVTGDVLLSVPSGVAWDMDEIAVEFDEIFSDGGTASQADVIDNIARSVHSGAIRDRHRRAGLDTATQRELWGIRQDLYPSLIFGLDVEGQLEAMDASSFPTMARKLFEINRAACEWTERGGDVPPWRCRVSPESDSTMRNPRLANARRFRNAEGVTRVFEWHARYGSSGRIHFIADAVERTIEIGYIGEHLPLA